MSWVRGVICSHSPNIGVCSGTSIGAASGIAEENGIDLLYIPGGRDDRKTFEASYGRRYRIDAGYPYLDRTVHIGGTVLIFLDTADRIVVPQQRMWLESVLTDTNIGVVRGSIAPNVVVFSSFPVFTPQRESPQSDHTIRDPEPLQELLLGFSRGPLRLSVFCSEEKEESHTVVGGIHQYGTPPAETGVRMIQIDRFLPIESVMMYQTEESVHG